MKNKFAMRKENRDAAIVLILVIMVCTMLFPFLFKQKDEPTHNKEYKKYDKTHFSQPGLHDGSKPAEADCELFTFDPNTADSTTLLRLGLRPWQVRSIYKYRSKGGRFYTKEDFAQLYGLTLEKYRQLEPYIKIKREIMAADVIKRTNRNTFIQPHATEDTKIHNKSNKLAPGQTIDINTADTTELKRIPGIGSYFAQRIVDLRRRRQAFTSTDELLQGIRNFPEVSLTYMTVSNNFKTIYINNVSLKELAKHPLVNYTQARDIINLRRTTGNIHSMEDLSALPSFTSKQLQRLAPFIVFKE